MSLFPCAGSWWVFSEKDPRWNRTGHVDCLVMGSRPQEAEEAIDELKKMYGAVPSDLTIYYDKD